MGLQDEYGFTALMNAATSVEVYATGDSMYSARAGGIEALRELINNRANLNLRDENRDTALIHATTGRLDSALLLLQSGADPNIINNIGETAYDRSKNPEIKILITKFRHVGIINYLKKGGFTYFSVIPNDLN